VFNSEKTRITELLGSERLLVYTLPMFSRFDMTLECFTQTGLAEFLHQYHGHIASHEKAMKMTKN